MAVTSLLISHSEGNFWGPFPNGNRNSLVWGPQRGGRYIASVPKLLNPASRLRRPVWTTLSVYWGSRMRRAGPFLLLLEPIGVPFLLIPVWDLLWGERPSRWKVFLFNCSGGVICPNTRLELQPSEYSQKASLSFEKQGAKWEVAWKMPLEVGEGDCWCDCDWKRASESLRETTGKAFLKCGVHSRMPWALLKLSWFWCDYTDCLVISQHPSWFVCHSHLHLEGEEHPCWACAVYFQIFYLLLSLFLPLLSAGI